MSDAATTGQGLTETTSTATDDVPINTGTEQQTTSTATAEVSTTTTDATIAKTEAEIATEAATVAAEAAKAKDDVKPGAPETYAAFTAPEGVILDGGILKEVTAMAKEFNLSQADAQRLVDFGLKLSEHFSKTQSETLIAAQKQWGEDTLADKEIGGVNSAANIAVGKKALETFGNAPLKALLNESGLGNHPEVVRFFYKVGKAINSDSIIVGKEHVNAEVKSFAEVLYGKTQQK